jgi:nitrate/nitrite transporter NarK
MKKNIFKSIGVILLAFIINALLSVVTDFLLESIGVLPAPEKGLFDTWAIILVLFYRGGYTILTGFIIAKLAPRKAMLYAIIVGIIGILITVIATNSPAFADKAPSWYGYTLAAITIPCLWLGVRIQSGWNKKRARVEA